MCFTHNPCCNVSVSVSTLLSRGCRVEKKLAKPLKLLFFSLPVSNCSGGKLNLEAFTIQVLVRGLDVLDYFKLITGRVVAVRPKFRKAFTSEI